MHKIIKMIFMLVCSIVLIGSSGTKISATSQPQFQRYNAFLHFEKNGGQGEMEDVLEIKSDHFHLPQNQFYNDDYVFIGWNTRPDGSGKSYLDGEALKENNHFLVLYAQWKLPAPENIKTVSQENNIKIKWSEVYGADYYTIKRSSNGKIYTIYDIKECSYTDHNVSQDSTVTYRITPMKLDGTAGLPSEEIVGTVLEKPVINGTIQSTESELQLLIQDSDENPEYRYQMKYLSDEGYSEKGMLKNNENNYFYDGFELDTNYEIAIRKVMKYSSNKCYSAWSEPLSVSLQNKVTIDNVSSDMAIEADVSLSGSGSGYHAKMVIGTPVSAVSFGIQHDKGAIPPYSNKTVALLENIYSNNAGGQNYPRFGFLEEGKCYKMLLTLNSDGTGCGYVNGFKVGEFENPYVVSTGAIHFWIEGAARLNGDSVNAGFQNVRYKVNGQIYSDIYEGATNIDTSVRNNGIQCIPGTESGFLQEGQLPTMRIQGQLGGIVSDWDYDYESASSVWMFSRTNW